MERTSKFDLLVKLATHYHRPTDSLLSLMNNCLNIISAISDGINIQTGELAWVEVFNLLYPRKNRQLTLF
jgi:hypothetical protein